MAFQISDRNYSSPSIFEETSSSPPFFDDESTTNTTAYEELPDLFKFNYRAKRMIIIYVSLFLVALIGNTTVFVSLVRARKKRRSRINLLMLHLAAADLGVTFVFIPVQIGWISTVTWEAPHWACPLLAGFFKAFPLYLSSLVLAVISLDRYYTIKYPLRKLRAEVQAKRLLLIAWIVALVSATPQLYLYRVLPHPDYPSYHQCVIMDMFPSRELEIAYQCFCAAVMYVVPLVAIVFAYFNILRIMCSRSKRMTSSAYYHHPSASNGSHHQASLLLHRHFHFSSRLSRHSTPTRHSIGTGGSMMRDGTCDGSSPHGTPSAMRASPDVVDLRIANDMGQAERAANRTLKMTVIIVVAFLMCWTPYEIIHFWYMISPQSASQDLIIQDVLCVFAVLTSCVDPLIYGSYLVNFDILDVLKAAFCMGRRQRANTGSTEDVAKPGYCHSDRHSPPRRHTIRSSVNETCAHCCKQEVAVAGCNNSSSVNNNSCGDEELLGNYQQGRVSSGNHRMTDITENPGETSVNAEGDEGSATSSPRKMEQMVT